MALRLSPRHDHVQLAGRAFIITCGLLYSSGKGEAYRLCMPDGDDDINTMPFTTHLSAQIAEW